MPSSKDLRLDGRVAIVTGAGRGIGRAEALDLARRGAAVVVNDIAVEHADEVVASILASGGQASANYDSVADPTGGPALVAQAVADHGGIDILVNNAGALRNGYFEDLSESDIDDVLATHLRGALRVTQSAWRVMKQQGRGRVVMTSSSSAIFGHQGLANYGAAKAGLYGAMKVLAYEGAPSNIKVNMVMPYAQTTIGAAQPVPDAEREWARHATEEQLAFLVARRDPQLTADLTTYLASDECRVNGEVFSVCAGRFARVFVGVARGWFADDPAESSAEAIAANLDTIRNLDGHAVPTWLYDEVTTVVAEHGGSASPGSR